MQKRAPLRGQEERASLLAAEDGERRDEITRPLRLFEQRKMPDVEPVERAQKERAGRTQRRFFSENGQHNFFSARAKPPSARASP